MIRTKRAKSKPVPADYAQCLALFPLRPLHDEVDYDNALEMADMLVGLTDLNDDQADYLDVLADIIQKYEAQRHTIDSGGTPLDALKRMLKEQGMTGSDLGRLLGNRPLGWSILQGNRQLSKAHIRILADHFKVSTDIFIS